MNDGILCKGGCGFYGNEIWNGYCSLCFPEKKVESPPNKNNPIINEVINKIDKSKKVTQRSLVNFKKFIKLTKDFLDDKPSSSNLSPEYFNVRKAFFDFFKERNDRFLQEIVPIIAARVEREELFKDIDSYAEDFQKMYSEIESKLNSSKYQKANSRLDHDEVMDNIENFATFWIHLGTFNLPAEEDENLKIQNIIKSLEWIRPSDLGSKLNLVDPKVKSMIEECILEMQNFSKAKSTLEKLRCLVSCSNKIFSAMKVYQESLVEGINSLIDMTDIPMPSLSEAAANQSTNADDFLPIFIYVILRANPNLLHSNILYISRFSIKERLQSGQYSYFFTHLIGAVEFIKKIDETALGLTKEEFDRRMNGIHPPVKPFTNSEGLFYQNEVNLYEIEKKTQTIETDLNRVEEDLIKFTDEMTNKIRMTDENTDVKTTVKLNDDLLANPFLLVSYESKK